MIDQSKTIYSQTSVQGASSKTKISIEKSKAQFINSISTIYSKIDKGIKDIVDTSETSRRNSEKINIKKFKKWAQFTSENQNSCWPVFKNVFKNGAVTWRTKTNESFLWSALRSSCKLLLFNFSWRLSFIFQTIIKKLRLISYQVISLRLRSTEMHWLPLLPLNKCAIFCVAPSSGENINIKTKT